MDCEPSRPQSEAASMLALAPRPPSPPCGTKRPLSTSTDESADGTHAKRQAKLQAEAKRKAAHASQRREVGLLYVVAAVDHEWLRCSVEFKEDPSKKGTGNRCGIRYQSKDGDDIENDDPIVRWLCGACSDRYAKDKQEGNRLPAKPDALVVGGRNHSGMREKSKLKKHETCEYHEETIRKLQEPPQPLKPQSKLQQFLSPERVLQTNYLMCVIWLCIHECAIAMVPDLIDLARVLGVSMPPKMSSYTTIELLHATAEFLRRLQRKRLAFVRVISTMGDGATDIADKEQEVIGIRYAWAGRPRAEFLELATLDLAESRDGESPDALCLSCTYDRSLNNCFTATTGDPQLDAVRD